MSPTRHNFISICTKLHHMVEFVIKKKPIVFEVKRSTSLVRFLKSLIFIPLTWNLKRIYFSNHWIQPRIIFEVNIDQKGQHRPNFYNFQFSSDWLEISRRFAYLFIEFNHQLFLRSNLFYVFCKYRALHIFFFFVCLFAGYLKSCARIRMKFRGWVGSVTLSNWLDFGEDPDPDPTSRKF